jgi:hypothetical protein
MAVLRPCGDIDRVRVESLSMQSAREHKPAEGLLSITVALSEDF